MDFLSRKLLSNDVDDDDLKKFCDRVCPKLPSDSCSSDCLEKCICSYGSFSIPPPPYDSGSKSPHKLSNLVTSTIALLSFTFLLVLCYAIYVRFYSGRRRRHRRRHLDPPPAIATHQEEFLDEEQGPVLDHPIWYIRTVGLPAAVIDAIGICKFKSGEGLIDGTECSVCLSEFEEDETLRLLPKCSHAFHLPCIDTWLRSHTNCPMCRAPVVAQSAAVAPPPPPAVASEETQMRDLQREVGHMANLGESSVRNDEEQDQDQEQDHEIHLPDDDPEETISDFQPTRRSVSLDSLSALGITSVLAAVNEKMDRDAELEQRNGNNSKKLSQGRGNSSSSAAAMNRNRSFKAIPVFNEASVSNYCSHGALRSESFDESVNSEETNDLKSRIFRLRLPKRSATNVLQRWTSEGNQVSITELRSISKDLRRLQRYKHALEILEWMVTHNEFDLSDSDFAIRIDLMTKVFGIDAAERYFEGLSIEAKTCETCTALLHSFAGSKLTEKAETLYEKIKESDIPLTALPFNEMMTLYMSVGQVEKVSSIVDDLKQRMVHPDIFTYNLWISSLAAALNIDGVRRILDEMKSNPSSNEDWVRYIELVNIYVTSAHLLHAESNSVVESESGISQREWITYDLLIILYAGMGNKDKIDQIWRSLRMTKQKMTSRNYICILSSYLMLDHLKEIGEVIDEWKQSTTTNFEVSGCNRLVNAFLEAGFNEKANSFVTLLIQKNCNPTEAED